MLNELVIELKGNRPDPRFNVCGGHCVGVAPQVQCHACVSRKSAIQIRISGEILHTIRFSSFKHVPHTAVKH